MRFECVTFDRGGRRQIEKVEAASRAEATDILGRKGLFVLEINEASEAALKSAATKGGLAIRRGSRTRCLAEFTRQLSILVGTGTPVVQAMAAVERQTKDEAFRAVVADVRRRVEEGSTLADAMEKHPRVFDAVARSLVAAGESGGHLDDMLSRLAALMRQQEVMRGSIVGAMVYPTLLIFVAVSVLVLMIAFVIPRFSGLFETLDAPLPPTTALLMSTSELLRMYWWAVIIVLGGSVVGALYWLVTPSGRQMLDTVAVRAPKLGRLIRSLATARIARLLGVLLESRVPLLESLVLTRQAMTNSHYRELLVKIEEAVTRGEAMSDALASSELVTPSFAEAVRNGEQGGRVSAVLLNLANCMDEDNAMVVKSVTSIIEPLILIALGLVVGFVAISMFLPLFDVTSVVQGGP
ncbi:MAG: type II secretion system F family protein [Phycisphaeraceae bacterium]|nr:type II secretion system F family protein [Phycisphaeraceae bacterium]